MLNDRPEPRPGVRLGKLFLRATDRFLARHSLAPTTPFLPAGDFPQVACAGSRLEGHPR